MHVHKFFVLNSKKASNLVDRVSDSDSESRWFESSLACDTLFFLLVDLTSIII